MIDPLSVQAAADVAVPAAGLSAQTVAVIVTGIVTVVGAIVAGIISVITTLRQTRNIVVAGQEASQTRGVVRDKKIQEIHLLVNSRLLTVLRLLVAVTKKEAERTKSAEDVAAYQEALAELIRAEASAKVVGRLARAELEEEESAADAADQKVARLTGKADATNA